MKKLSVVLVVLAAVGWAHAQHDSAQEGKLRAMLPEVFAKCAAHYRALDAAATPLMNSGDPAKTVPRGNKPHAERLVPHGWDAKTGKLDMRSIYWWTSGHFPGSLWYIYEATGDNFFKDRAIVWTETLSPNSKVSDNHDVGFIMYCSFGNARRLLNTDKYDDLLRETAASLSKRFNDRLGLIRSWGELDEKKDFFVIPDNMMNLELLTYSAKLFGADSLVDMSITHAQTTMKNHFRDDYSCYHLVDYDPETGDVLRKATVQGYADESAWARGQAWAVYGYTMMFRETGRKEFLTQAENIARMLLSRLPYDGIPFWDFDDPSIPYTYKDASAGAVMASAFIELSTLTKDKKLSKKCLAKVEKQIRALASKEYLAPVGENGNFLLMHSVGNLNSMAEVDSPLIYADYYFLEALYRYINL